MAVGPLMAGVPMIVVGGTNLGESDRIVRFLSADEGRSDGLARAARSSRKRFAGVLDPGTRLVVSKRKGRGSLEVIGEVDLVSSPDRARTDLERIALLVYGCELCSALAPEHHPARKLTRLLEVWLDVLEGEVQPGHAARQALEAKALTFAGLAPMLTVCATCGQPLAEGSQISSEAGGAVHPWCGSGRSVTIEALAQLELLRRTPLADVVDNRLPAATEGASWLLSDFATWQLGRPLRSRSLLQEVLGDSHRDG